MTIKQALLWADRKLRGTEDPKKSAYFLLKNVIFEDESFILAYPEFLLSKRQELKFRRWILKRQKHLPVWYIAGFIDFYGLTLKVNKNVLIPRPETEVLVEMILSDLCCLSPYPELSKNCHSGLDPESIDCEKRLYKGILKQVQNDGISYFLHSRTGSELGGAGLVLADIGTGSGAIGLSLAKKLPEAKVYAIDISAKAINLAKKNSKINNIQNVVFKKGNLLDPLKEKANIIVANLPYIPTNDLNGLAFDIIHHEPRLALDGGKDGLDIYRQFFIQVTSKIKSGGKIYLEIGENQGEKIRDLALDVFPNANVLLKKDWAGLDRYVVLEM